MKTKLETIANTTMILAVLIAVASRSEEPVPDFDCKKSNPYCP